MSELKPLIVDLHIPYCIQPERYLRLYGAVGTNAEKNAYMAALKREVLSNEGELDGYEVKAVRLSGGSATVMSPDLLGDLLSTVRKVMPVAHGAEVSFDAHPLTIGTPALTGIANGQPNRAELMMRSSLDSELQALGCAFTMQHVQNAMLFFHRFRMNNVSLTVNYGIPGQTLDTWHNTLRACLIMSTGHIRVCPLDVTEAPGMPSAQEREEMRAHAHEVLTAEGYHAYTDTDYALPGHESVGLQLRQSGCEYLGLGVDGRSRQGGYLFRNTNNLRLYMQHAGNPEKTIVQVLAEAEA